MSAVRGEGEVSRLGLRVEASAARACRPGSLSPARRVMCLGGAPPRVLRPRVASSWSYLARQRACLPDYQTARAQPRDNASKIKLERAECNRRFCSSPCTAGARPRASQSRKVSRVFEADQPAKIIRYGYGEIRSIETFENDFGVVFRVAFFGRSDAARAARELSSQTSGVQRFSCEPRPPPPVFRHLSFCIYGSIVNTWNHLTDTCCLLIHLPAAPTLLPCFANSTTPAASAYSVSSRPRPTWSPAT